MTERERWVVYPLLFLALGASLRDKLVDRTTAKSIVCQELTVVEDEPVGNQPVRVLARIGKTEATPTTPSHGYLGVNGEVDVDGSLKVNGVVNAKQYAHQGMLVAPTLQSLPGIPLADLLRALQAAQARQQANAQSPEGQPKKKSPAVSPDGAQKAAPPDSHTDGNAPPKK